MPDDFDSVIIDGVKRQLSLCSVCYKYPRFPPSKIHSVLQLFKYPVIMSADLAEKIKNQVEFYFSGLNLKRDKFMREKMSADPEGCIVVSSS